MHTGVTNAIADFRQLVPNRMWGCVYEDVYVHVYAMYRDLTTYA